MTIPFFGCAPGAAPPSRAPDTRARYAVLFASQRRLYKPQHAHSFAAFVEVETGPRGDDFALVSTFTLSWLPVSLKIRLFGGPEPGRNPPLAETLDWARALGADLTAWGPFEVEELLFRKARRRYDELETGVTRYMAIDTWYRPHRATNCIHALSDLGLTPRLLRTGVAYGPPATARIAALYRPWIVRPDRADHRVGELLGLHRYPVTYRPLAPGPASERSVSWQRWLFPGYA